VIAHVFNRAPVDALILQNGTEGFPSNLLTTVVYTLEKNSIWNIKMKATVEDNGKTPILLSSHVFWNLDAYQAYDTNDSDKFLNGGHNSRHSNQHLILLI
jgi:galactose mutarotase-like enzyme